VKITDCAWWCDQCNTLGSGNQPWLGGDVFIVDDGIPICCGCNSRLHMMKAVAGSSREYGRSFERASAEEWREVTTQANMKGEVQ